MAEPAPTAMAARGPQPATEILRQLMADGGWTNRSLAAATQQHGRPMGQSSIGNIRRGDDHASPETLAYLATVMGHPPDVFLEVRLARARRLFDVAEVGLEAAAENYRELEMIFPGVGGVDRLIETLDDDQGRAVEIHAEWEAARTRVLAQARESTGAGSSLPQGGEVQTGHRNPVRQRPREAS